MQSELLLHIPPQVGCQHTRWLSLLQDKDSILRVLVGGTLEERLRRISSALKHADDEQLWLLRPAVEHLLADVQAAWTQRVPRPSSEAAYSDTSYEGRVHMRHEAALQDHLQGKLLTPNI